MTSTPPTHALNAALAATLKAARLKRGLKRRELGERMGCGPKQVSRHEGGREGVRLHTLRRFADGLGTTAWELLRSAEQRCKGEM